MDDEVRPVVSRKSTGAVICAGFGPWSLSGRFISTSAAHAAGEIAIARIVVIRLDGIGDAMLLAPLFSALLEAGHSVGGVFRPDNLDLYLPTVIDRHCLSSDEDEARLTTELREAQYDAALIVTEKPIGYRLARKAKIGRRVGFVNGFAKPLKSLALTLQLHERRPRPVRDTGVHEVRMIYSLGRSFDLPVDPPRDPRRLRKLFLTDDDGRESRWAAPGSAGSGGPWKRRMLVQMTAKWLASGPVDFVAGRCKLMEIAAAKVGYGVTLIGAARENEFLEAVASRSGLPVRQFEELPPWLEMISAADLLVTPDTGAAHVAGIFGIPCIDVFAANVSALLQARWQPWAGKSVLLTMNDVKNDGSRALTRAISVLAADAGSTAPVA